MASLNRLKLLMLFTMVLIFGTLFVLIAVATTLFEVMTDLPLWLGIPFAIFMSVIFIFIQWYTSPWLVAWASRLQYLKPGENPWLESTVKQLATQAQVPVPKLAIVPDPSPNAFVFGRTKGSSTLAVHEGLLQRLDKSEVTAVLAHEIGHMRHNDCVVMTIVSAVPIIAYMVGRSFMTISYFGGGSRSRRSGTGLILAIIVTAITAWVVYFISQLLVMWLSRSREYYADAYSAYSTQNPSALASALSKITYGLSISHDEPSGLRAFCIGDPSTAKHDISDVMDHKDEYDLDKNGVLDERELELAMQKQAGSTWNSINELFSTHPSTYKRIIMLKSIEREMGTSKLASPDDVYKFV